MCIERCPHGSGGSGPVRGCLPHEVLFIYRQMVGFHGEYSEPAIGWIGEVSQNLLQLGKHLEQDANQPTLPAPPVWTDSKLRRREALMKLARGQKLSHDSHTQSQGMMGC